MLTVNTWAKPSLAEVRSDFVDHHTYNASEFVEFLSTTISHTRIIHIPLLQTFLSSIRLHRYSLGDGKKAWIARYEGLSRRIIRNVQKSYSGSDAAQTEALVVERLLVRFL